MSPNRSLDDMKDAINGETLSIPNIIERYRDYLQKNREAFFKNVPRRKNRPENLRSHLSF